MSTWNWPHPGCVGLWHLQDNAIDSSGAGNNGTAGGGVVYTPGKFGKCAYLTLDSISLPAGGLKLADFTVSFWYRGIDPASIATIYTVSGLQYSGGWYFWGVSIRTVSGRIQLAINQSQYDGIRLINDDAWHRVTVARDDDYARIFIDGIKDHETARPTTPGYIGPSDARIGGEYKPAIEPAIGYLPTCHVDEMLVLDYVISPEEELATYLFQAGII